MKKFIHYTELAILVLALYFTHLKLSSDQYLDAAFAIISVLIYRGISIYKTKKFSKLDSVNRAIIADLEKRLEYEMQIIARDCTEIETELQEIDRDQLIIDKLKSGQSGKSISEETGIHVSTISRLKKKYL